MKFFIRHFASVDSTNTMALDQARRGAAEGLCIVAKQQTAGRGRHGREWISPDGAGIYLSVVLRPEVEIRFLPLLTLLAAVAVFDTLAELHGLQPDIKWPNDVLVGEKKISGILAETAETGLGLAVALGIGINLTSENFPAGLSETAVSIAAATARTPDAEKTLEFLLKRISELYDCFIGETGAELICRNWTERSSYAFGKSIRVLQPGRPISGITRGIQPDGALRIECAGGELISVRAGDVELVRDVRTH